MLALWRAGCARLLRRSRPSDRRLAPASELALSRVRLALNHRCTPPADAAQVLSGAGSDGGHRGRIFVASDDHPVTFGDMIAACTESGAFEGGVEFTGTGPPASKRMSSAASRQELGGFECKYRSFVDFMHEHKGRDWYSEQKL